MNSVLAVRNRMARMDCGTLRPAAESGDRNLAGGTRQHTPGSSPYLTDLQRNTGTSPSALTDDGTCMKNGKLNNVAPGEPAISESDLRSFLEAGH